MIDLGDPALYSHLYEKTPTPTATFQPKISVEVGPDPDRDELKDALAAANKPTGQPPTDAFMFNPGYVPTSAPLPTDRIYANPITDRSPWTFGGVGYRWPDPSPFTLSGTAGYTTSRGLFQQSSVSWSNSDRPIESPAPLGAFSRTAEMIKRFLDSTGLSEIAMQQLGAEIPVPAIPNDEYERLRRQNDEELLKFRNKPVTEYVREILGDDALKCTYRRSLPQEAEETE